MTMFEKDISGGKREGTAYIYICVTFFAACLVFGNVIEGLLGIIDKSGLTDDFVMRYRESKYLWHGVNPFDVIFGNTPVNLAIGELWDVAGYTPWGMTFGILFNLTFLSERYARYTFIVIYLCVMFASGFAVYQFVRKGEDGKEYAIFKGIAAAMLVLALPGWGTGLNWLNFGAIFGAFLCFAVVVMDAHPILAGVLLGCAATKPQLAAPFYLCLLCMGRYKSFLTAVVLPLILSAICWLLQGTDPLTMFFQFAGNMQGVGTVLGNWISGLGVYYEFNASHQIILAVGAASCILLALTGWICMRKSGVADRLAYCSLAAILSGMWTYSQTHDRTVLMIPILWFFTRDCGLPELRGLNRRVALLFCFFAVIDMEKLARLFSLLFAAGISPVTFFTSLKYAIWMCTVFWIIWRSIACARSRG